MDRNTEIGEEVINMPLCSHYRLTADKREIKDFPKLWSATSFIRQTLSEIAIFLKVGKL